MDLLGHRCYTWKAQTSRSPFFLPFSSHPVWPSRFASGHLLQRAQGDTWLLRLRVSSTVDNCAFFFFFVSSTKELKVPVQLVQTSTHPLCSLVLFQRDGNLWLCCEGHSSRLTHFQLTDTIIHCSCTSVQPELCPSDSQANVFSARSAETCPSRAMSRWKPK